MVIRSASFVCSNSDYKKCPANHLPEYALIGRSNVGKSSLINMLLSNKSLAKTSGKPGKTQLINHFMINENWHLVDLPGYGWASVGKQQKADFSQMNANYLANREVLQCVFVLIDSRLPPQKIDLEFLRWIGQHGIPFAIVFTKIDKQTPTKTLKNIEVFQETLLQEWEELPPHFMTSAEKGDGRDELLSYIDGINKQFNY